MMLGVLDTNRANVLAALGRFRTDLDALEAALRREDLSALQSLLDRAAARHAELTS
jgi:prephenate dehydrogenase